MLILRRSLSETVHIGNDVHVTVLRIEFNQGGKPVVHIGIEAPDSTKILRAELMDDQRKDSRNARTLKEGRAANQNRRLDHSDGRTDPRERGFTRNRRSQRHFNKAG